MTKAQRRRGFRPFEKPKLGLVINVNDIQVDHLGPR